MAPQSKSGLQSITLNPTDVKALNKEIDLLQKTADTQRVEISTRRRRIAELRQSLSSVSTVGQATINQSLWASAMICLLKDKATILVNGEQVLAARVGNFISKPQTNLEYDCKYPVVCSQCDEEIDSLPRLGIAVENTEEEIQIKWFHW
jgi:hypothetical protein